MDSCFQIQKLTYEFAEDLAKKFYKKNLMGRSIRVSVLKSKVSFTRTGWNHFVDKDRSINELITRFFALPLAEIVLRKSDKLVDYERRKSCGNWNEYWALEYIVEGVLIRVVICSINKGAKFFLSCVWKGNI